MSHPLPSSALKIAVAGLITLAIAMGIGRFAFTPLLPMMLEDAGLSMAAGGWLASANYLGYLLGALSAIWLHVRPEPAIRLGLVLISASTMAMGLSDHFVAWIIWRAAAGILSAWVLIHASAWCVEQLAVRARLALSGVVFAGVGIGIAITGTLCVLLMNFHATSAQGWMAFGILALIFTAAVWSTFATKQDATLSDPTPETRNAAHKFNGDAWRLVFCYAAFGFGYIIPATFLPVMAKQAINNPAVFGWSWPIFGTAGLLSTLATAPLERHISDRRLWAASHLIMAIGVVLPIFWSGMGGIVLAALCVGGTFMVITMTAIREARTVAGKHAPRLVAAMTAAFAVGQAAGPISASYFVHVAGSFTLALMLAAGFLLLSAALLMRRAPL